MYKLGKYEWTNSDTRKEIARLRNTQKKNYYSGEVNKSWKTSLGLPEWAQKEFQNVCWLPNLRDEEHMVANGKGSQIP